MSLCSRCGASLPGNAVFCPECGTAFSRANSDQGNKLAPHATNDDQQPVSRAEAASSSESVDQMLPIPENVAGFLAYITIIPAIVFLILEPFKRNFFVRFHSFQHLFLWVAGLVSGVAMAILSALLQLIPFMRVVVFPLAGLIGLAWFFLWLLLVVKAYQHQMFKLPIIGDLAEQQAGA